MSSFTAGDIFGLSQVVNRCFDLLHRLYSDEWSRDLPLVVRDRARIILIAQDLELPTNILTQFAFMDDDSEEIMKLIAKELPDERRQFHRNSSDSTLPSSTCKGTAWLEDRVATTGPARATRKRASKVFLNRGSLLSALRKPTSTLALATGQFACITAMHTYEFCNCARSSSSAGDQSCPTHNSDFNQLNQWFQGFVNILPPILSDFRNVSTSTFVLSGMAWTVLAMFQHHINERDRFERSAVLIGLVAGFAMCLPSLSRPEEQQVIASVMAFCVTIAMLLSAFGHWVGGVIRGQKEVALEDGDGDGRKDVQQYADPEKETV